MAYRVKSNNGKTVVLAQSHLAKIALSFSKEYSLINAVNLAALSKLVYGQFRDVEPALRLLTFKNRTNFSTDASPEVKPFLVPYLGKKTYATEGLTEIKADKSLFSIIDTQAFHYNDDEYNVLAFRGTQELKDFAADGFAPKHGFISGDVHKGFHDNFQAIKNQIREILAKPENTKCKTIIAGHSLGGAIGTLASAYISMNFKSEPCGQVMLYTYGSPRVGVVQWVDSFADRFIHFRHRRVHDPISMLPPHHSSMKMPSLPVRVISQAIGGIGLVVGEAIFRPGEAEYAFVHHGQGILLREGEKGAWVLKTDLKKEFVVPDGVGWNSKEALLAREFYMNVKAFSKGIGPHSMAGYFSNLFYLLQSAIKAWDHDPKIWLEINKTISKEQAEFIEVWKKARDKAATEFLVKPAVQSSTSVPESRQPISQEEKSAFYDDLIANATHLKMQADMEIKKWSQPDAKAKLLQLILPLTLTPPIEKELRFQLAVSKEAVPPPPPPPNGWDIVRPYQGVAT